MHRPVLARNMPRRWYRPPLLANADRERDSRSYPNRKEAKASVYLPVLRGGPPTTGGGPDLGDVVPATTTHLFV